MVPITTLLKGERDTTKHIASNKQTKQQATNTVLKHQQLGLILTTNKQLKKQNIHHA
jgi:hypothetical protein